MLDRSCADRSWSLTDSRDVRQESVRVFSRGSTLRSRFRIRHAAALALTFAGAFALVLLLPEQALAVELRDGLRDGVRDGLVGIAAADSRWLVVTGVLLAASLAGSALAWRAALGACGASCGPVDAVARYGVGSLANAMLPMRVGGVIRIALFSRLVHGEGAVWTTASVRAVRPSVPAVAATTARRTNSRRSRSEAASTSSGTARSASLPSTTFSSRLPMSHLVE